MPIPVKTLSVKANPYAHVDHMGRPAGACPELFDGNAPRRAWVGAKLVSKETKAAKTATAVNEAGQSITFTDEAAEHDVWFEFQTDPDGTPVTVKVPNDPYYRGAILRHELFAADEATWRACGMRGGFQDPHELIAHHAGDAVAKHSAHYGAEFADEIQEPCWQEHAKAAPASPPPAPSANRATTHEEV